MKFVKFCPECRKAYTNGAIGRCGKCQVDLVEIKWERTVYFKGGCHVVFQYKIKKNEQPTN